MKALRSAVASILAVLLVAAPSLAQQGQEQAAQQSKPAPVAIPQGPDYSKGRGHLPNIFGPYAPIRVPAPVLTNSPRVEQLIRDGNLYISLQDAIALALENNLDLAIARYNLSIADTDILRTKAGAAARGVATGLVQGTPGGGVGGFGTAATGTGTASVLGAIPTNSFDPQLNVDFSMDQRSTPISNPFLAGTGSIVDAITNRTTRMNFSYSQGFKTGTGIGVTFNNNRQSTTSSGAFINPALSSSLFVSMTQPLLNGFGFVSNMLLGLTLLAVSVWLLRRFVP